MPRFRSKAGKELPCVSSGEEPALPDQASCKDSGEPIRFRWGSLRLPLAISTAKRDEARKLWHRLSRVTRALWLDSAASPQAKSQGDFSWKRAFSGAYLISRRWAVSAGSALRRAGSLLSCRSHHFTHVASLEPEVRRRST